MIKTFLIWLVANSSLTYTDVRLIDETQLRCISKAVYHEARGEEPLGKIAVAYVVLNRQEHRWSAETPCEIVHEPEQFTDIEFRTIPKQYKKVSYMESIEAATLSYLGLVDDPTNGAIMYHNPKTAPNPRWDFSKLEYTVTIGNHRFYREKVNDEN